MPLTEAQFQQVLRAPEDAYLERKPETANREEIRRTAVAFANTVEDGREAVLLIGVDDNGNALGVQNPDVKQRDVRRILMEDCYPPIQHQAQVFGVAGRNVVAITIPSSGQRPHFSGPAFVRRGAESVNATAAQHEDLIASRTEKCRVLQGWRDQPITILEDRYRLDRGPVQGEWRAVREGRIVSCDSHTVRLRDSGSDAHFTLQLHQVEIGYDEQRHRKLLRVHP
jgi:predicted HTH transcriptional regulator